MMLPKLETSHKGVFFAVLGAVTYGMNPLFSLPMYSQGVFPESVLFYRYLFATILLAGWLFYFKIPFRVPRENLIPTLLGGPLCGISSLALYMSYMRMDAGLASTLLFVCPVMIALIMFFGFKEKLTRQTIIGIAGAFCGVGILSRTSDGVMLDLLGFLLVMLSALSYAIYMVMVKTTGLNRMNPFQLVFYVMAGGIPVFLFYGVLNGCIQWLPDFSLWSCAFALGLIPSVVSFVSSTYGVQYIGPTKTAILSALEPLTAVVFGVLIFGEVLTIRLCIGFLVIFIAVTLTILGGEKCKAG
ncbi:MAG: EamA family transporter [Lentisphaeria bacterium]|nr:EamA family transporter [Lentisphaeria bacterium]